MKHLEADTTMDAAWQAENMDRLLGFEILSRTLRATFQPMAPELLADKVGMDKGMSFKMVKEIAGRMS
jgi:hypothetical protein